MSELSLRRPWPPLEILHTIMLGSDAAAHRQRAVGCEPMLPPLLPIMRIAWRPNQEEKWSATFDVRSAVRAMKIMATVPDS